MLESVEIYIDENNSLSKSKKESLSKRLKDIYDKLENKTNLEDFFESQIIEVTHPEENYIRIKNKCLLLFIIKIIGTFFVTLYLIGIFELICIMDAIKKEFYSSLHLFFLRKNEEGRKDFYTNFINISKKIPSFSPFFLSSLISKIIINLLGFYITSILVLIINGLIIYFGLINFPFRKENELEENYTLKEVLNLFFMFAGIYLTIGIVVLLPLETVQKGFQEYDKDTNYTLYQQYQHFRARVYGGIEAEENDEYDEDKVKEAILKKKELIKEKEKTIKDNILKQKGENLDMDERIYANLRLKYKMNINGYLIFYLFSMVASSICQIMINRYYFSDYNEGKKEKINIVIKLSTLFISLSLILFFLYSTVFNFNEKKENKEVSVTKFGGYIIYRENYVYDSFCKRFWSDIAECFKKWNYACCCQLCSCLYFFKCILCFCCSCEKYNKREKMITNDTKKENICIIYKINGFFSYFSKILTNPKVLIFVPLLYLFNLFNIGFNSVLSEINENFIINILSLLSILLFFFINYLFGKILAKYFDEFDDDKDFYIIVYGLFSVVLFESIFSSIISCLIYFNGIGNNTKGYFIIISLQSIEYIKIISLNYFAFYFKINSLLGDLLSNSFILSFYIIIWRVFEIFINICDINKSLILFQFIFGLIIFIFMIIVLKLMKKKGDFYDIFIALVDKID